MEMSFEWLHEKLNDLELKIAELQNAIQVLATELQKTGALPKPKKETEKK